MSEEGAMTIALCAVPLVAQLIASMTVPAADQSQFTRPAQPAGEMQFRDMDRNNDGVVTRAEWRGSDQSFRVHDWNGDGVLSGQEVRADVERPLAREADDAGLDREDTFENLDDNRDNRIDRSEWRGSADAFRWLDRNNDGTLSRQEVVGRRGARNRRDPQAGAPVSAAPGDCDQNAARIVDDIYQQVLERPADPASAELTQELDAGRMTVRDVVAALAKSEEHATRFYWHPVATAIYRQMLNRDPNPQELRDTTADLATGQGAMLDVIARTARRAAASDEEAVRLLYRRLLGREADEQGLRGFTDLARRDGIVPVARQIAASPEYQRRNGIANTAPDDRAAYQNAVASFYRHVLGRAPDPQGLETLTRVAVTSGFDMVVDHMVTSAEYQQRYGTDVVPGRNVRYCGQPR
jgi:Ca2+-binding EF-hand superfamily protein